MEIALIAVIAVILVVVAARRGWLGLGAPCRPCPVGTTYAAGGCQIVPVIYTFADIGKGEGSLTCPSSTIKVLAAVYGPSDQTVLGARCKNIDVTAALQAATVEGADYTFSARPASTFGDPCYGQSKTVAGMYACM